MNIYIQTSIYTYTSVDICRYSYIYTYKHKHTYIYTHTLTAHPPHPHTHAPNHPARLTRPVLLATRVDPPPLRRPQRPRGQRQAAGGRQGQCRHDEQLREHPPPQGRRQRPPWGGEGADRRRSQCQHQEQGAWLAPGACVAGALVHAMQALTPSARGGGAWMQYTGRVCAMFMCIYDMCVYIIHIVYMCVCVYIYM